MLQHGRINKLTSLKLKYGGGGGGGDVATQTSWRYH